MGLSRLTLFTTGAVVAGFVVGVAIGKETNAAAQDNISTEFDDGTITVKLNLFASISNGLGNFLNGFG